LTENAELRAENTKLKTAQPDQVVNHDLPEEDQMDVDDFGVHAEADIDVELHETEVIVPEPMDVGTVEDQPFHCPVKPDFPSTPCRPSRGRVVPDTPDSPDDFPAGHSASYAGPSRHKHVPFYADQCVETELTSLELTSMEDQVRELSKQLSAAKELGEQRDAENLQKVAALEDQLKRVSERYERALRSHAFFQDRMNSEVRNAKLEHQTLLEEYGALQGQVTREREEWSVGKESFLRQILVHQKAERNLQNLYSNEQDAHAITRGELASKQELLLQAEANISYLSQKLECLQTEFEMVCEAVERKEEQIVELQLDLVTTQSDLSRAHQGLKATQAEAAQLQKAVSNARANIREYKGYLKNIAQEDELVKRILEKRRASLA